MKNLKAIMMLACLVALGVVAMFGLFGMPDEEKSIGEWLALFAGSKAVGLMAVGGILLALKFNARKNWI